MLGLYKFALAAQVILYPNPLTLRPHALKKHIELMHTKEMLYITA